MKYLSSLFMACVVLSMPLLGDTKRYEVSSGEIEYTIEGGGKMIGMQTSTSGTKNVVFKDWGNVEVSESRETTKMSGQQPQSEHTLVKFEDGKVYSVDFEDKVIYFHDIMGGGYDKISQNYTQYGRDMLEQNGGKRVGSEKLLGYNCEVWEWQGMKMWVYKGVMLKITSNMMGVTHTERATKAKFGVTIPSERFALPKYPVKKADAMYEEALEGEDMSEEEKAQAKELMKSFGFGQ
ncbi:MAG: hypothetical protein AB7D43_03770 [Sulfurimonadaceae bacterium]